MGYAFLSEDVKIVQAVTITAGAAGLTDVNGATIDTAGYDRVLFVVQFGAIVATAVTSIKAQQGALSDLSDAADLAGTAVSVADSDDDTVKYLDLGRPLERYVRVVVDRGTANATCAAMAYLYKARTKPPTHGAGVVGEKWLSPAEGTA